MFRYASKASVKPPRTEIIICPVQSIGIKYHVILATFVSCLYHAVYIINDFQLADKISLSNGREIIDEKSARGIFSKLFFLLFFRLIF